MAIASSWSNRSIDGDESIMPIAFGDLHALSHFGRMPRKCRQFGCRVTNYISDCAQLAERENDNFEYDGEPVGWRYSGGAASICAPVTEIFVYPKRIHQIVDRLQWDVG